MGLWRASSQGDAGRAAVVWRIFSFRSYFSIFLCPSRPCLPVQGWRPRCLVLYDGVHRRSRFMHVAVGQVCSSFGVGHRWRCCLGNHRLAVGHRKISKLRWLWHSTASAQHWVGKRHMNLSPFMRGTAVVAYLLFLAALLFVILIRRGIPRHAALKMVEISAGIFSVGLCVTYWLAEQMTMNGGDSLLIYLPPVVPIGIFVLWLLPRKRTVK